MVLWVNSRLASANKEDAMDKADDEADNHRERLTKYTIKQADRSQSHEHLVNMHLSEVLAFVNWDYISLPLLIDVCKNQPLFR